MWHQADLRSQSSLRPSAKRPRVRIARVYLEAGQAQPTCQPVHRVFMVPVELLSAAAGDLLTAAEPASTRRQAAIDAFESIVVGSYPANWVRKTPLNLRVDLLQFLD